MNKVSNEDFKRFVEESYTYADVCRKIGWKPQGGNYRYIKKYIKELGLDVSHFTGKGSNICNRLGCSKEKNIEEYLTTDSYIKADRLKWKLFSNGLKQYKCEKCGCTHWNDGQISLQLHHINGDNTDNRLENLQVLCPNCHSQTDNFCGANRGDADTNKKHYCKMCGNEISKTLSGLCDKCYDKLCNGVIEFGLVKQRNKETKAKITSLIPKRHSHKEGVCKICGEKTSDINIDVCVKCSKKLQRKVKWPSKEELESLIKEKPFTKIAEQYGVSDKAITKWCKHYGLPYRKKDIRNS